eukprot:6165634-Pleurochrysis_carterae.AAC.1
MREEEGGRKRGSDSDRETDGREEGTEGRERHKREEERERRRIASRNGGEWSAGAQTRWLDTQMQLVKSRIHSLRAFLTSYMSAPVRLPMAQAPHIEYVPRRSYLPAQLSTMLMALLVRFRARHMRTLFLHACARACVRACARVRVRAC